MLALPKRHNCGFTTIHRDLPPAASESEFTRHVTGTDMMIQNTPLRHLIRYDHNHPRSQKSDIDL